MFDTQSPVLLQLIVEVDGQLQVTVPPQLFAQPAPQTGTPPFKFVSILQVVAGDSAMQVQIFPAGACAAFGPSALWLRQFVMGFP